MPTINPSKGKSENYATQDERRQKMESAISDFLHTLSVKHDQFDCSKAFDELQRYIDSYERILYSTISNIIYSSYEEAASDDQIGTIMSNLDSLVAYADEPKNISDRVTANSRKKEAILDTRKAIYKIWDHVNLANQQYKVLKQTDDEYTEKFEKRISGYKEEMTKEMNSQLLTLVGMFTALAFLVFGGISSLDNIFSVNGIPLLKLMIIGCIWGLCILNLIFVFLFCIGKMTKQNFKSTEDVDATVFQKYPIVWWSDLFLCAILIMCSWLWYVNTTGLDGWLIKICVSSPVLAFAIGSSLILGIIIVAIIWLARRTSRRRI